ncbi:isopeptide-forming domain-containing fimbrial protein [Leptolyngbya sp. NIES-2104]|uniref:isopeptide-forming domain-containing fimbrial protein n=1 Tax=Leptolyngbya sp. NIES-2104 TaxID=1552121 RepID=UPI0006EC7BCC|nr:isopeptide-forming domain-containing fimbrial protein [Leptolyngbya sp. NIES-2104]GAP95482.1 internalin, putative [Leptolyngbya sp. NIES-2104]
MCICAIAPIATPVRAEGSKELVQDGGSRPFLEWSGQISASIPRSTTLRVFVRLGEIVHLGSSVANSYDDGGGAGKNDIVYRRVGGGQSGSCDVLATGFGYINTPVKENIGPNPGGYTPCTFTATATGIYEVEFRGQQRSTNDVGNPPATTVESPTSTTAFTFLNNQIQTVGAWDITVKDSTGTTTLPGRVFTYYVAMNLGANSRSLNSNFFIQTKDGFRYRTDMNGLDPFGFIFFANSRGYIDRQNGATLYRSARATDNALNFIGNVAVQAPSTVDTATDITHLIFFNRPDSNTLTELNIPLSPIMPGVPQNFKFTGASGSSGNQTPVGAGGFFSFSSNTPGTYQIIIDTNADGIFDPSVDRVLQNPASAGVNIVSWDGKDANGTNVPPRTGNAAYPAQVVLRGGEYHFPLLDVENNPSGFKITMENHTAAFPTILDTNGQSVGPATIYYNDTNYTTANGTSVTLTGTGATSPTNASRGVNSGTSGEHEFSSNYGDFKGIDTWTFFPSEAITAPLVITTNERANVIGRKSVRFLADADEDGKVTIGDRVEYTVTYSNLSPGNSNATNFVLSDSLPAQLSYVPGSATLTQTPGNTISINSSYNGTGALTNSGTLRVGDTITVRLIATINDANNGAAIVNQASATFSTPDNPGSVAGTVLSDANSAGATLNPPTVGNPFFQLADDGINSGNDLATSADDDPTVITVPLSPRLRLVKRVTAIQGTALSSYVDVVSGVGAASDNAPNWINSSVTANRSNNSGTTPNFSAFLRGVIDTATLSTAQKPKPGDEVEYTIYFLSDGDRDASTVSLCDFIPANTTYVVNSLELAIGLNPAVPVTDILTDSDGGYYTTGFPGACSGSTNNGRGAIVVNAGTLQRSTGSGTPSTSFGLIRFRARVN